MGDPLSIDLAMAGEERTPCPHCGAAILVGAKKCRSCRQWTTDAARQSSGFARSLTLVSAAALATAAVLISSRDSPVGEAPPLTTMAAAPSSAEATITGDPAPAALGPGLEARQPAPLETEPDRIHAYKSRQLQIDVHPLDVVFSPTGKSVFVSSDDATVREYELSRGKLVHMASVPAQGDSIRLLHGRYIAVLRKVDATYVPVMDTQSWERDPMLLWVGLNPADVVAMPDGKTALAASSGGKRLTWWDLTSGRRLGNIRLAHATTQLYPLASEGRVMVGAIGTLYQGERSTGAWIDLFDPSEEPFGATRRSISAGRDPRAGVATHGGTRLFYVDHVSNVASLLEVGGSTHVNSVMVGRGPVGAFAMAADRYGVTLDSGSRTVTIIELARMERVATLMLGGSPRDGALSPDGSTLVVSLGGDAWPPTGSGAVVIAGDPPTVIATLETGKGASRVAMSPDGRRAAVANYHDKALTLIER